MIKLGKKVAIMGKIIMITVQTSIAARKGNTPLKILCRGTFGAIDIITNTFTHSGGEISHISAIKTSMTPNHIGSKPRRMTIGKKMGMVSTINPMESIKVPPKK